MCDERAAAARMAGVAAMAPALLAIWFSADALGRDDPGVRYVRETLARRPGEGYALACAALRDADLRVLAPRITARMFVVCGDDDIPSFLEAAALARRHHPAGRIRFDQRGEARLRAGATRAGAAADAELPARIGRQRE